MKVQILRFYAALLVAIVHVGVAVEEMARAKALPFTMRYPLDWGLGVDLFFIISGFIMYFTMHDRFGEKGVWRVFLRRRLIRIVPLYWICTTLMLVSILMAAQLINHNAVNPIHILASYLFIPWPNDTGDVFPLFTLGWTLNLEMFFYAAFAIALLMPKRIGLTLLFVSFSALWLTGAFFSADHWLLKFWGLSLILEFLMGICLAHCFLKGIRIPLSATIVATMIGLIAAVLFYQTDSYDILPRALTGGIPAILIAGSWILCQYMPDSRLSKLLAIGGDASYALYLSHPFTAKIVVIVAGKIGIWPIAAFCLALAAAIAVSIGVHFLIEKPIDAQLRRWFDKRRKPERLESDTSPATVLGVGESSS
jgi:peptidoglycan/LPS O-acetylase OafA/YrhL